MAKSKLRHTVAVLRNEIGLAQKNFADLAGCSMAAIQSIEVNSGRLKLSLALGERIARETGVDLKWLMDNKPDAPIVGELGEPYTNQTFEEHRSQMEAAFGGSPSIEKFCVEALLAQVFGLYAVAANNPKRFSLLNYKLHKAADTIQADLGLEINPKVLSEFHARWKTGNRVKESVFDVRSLANVFWSELKKAKKKHKAKA